jgi:hypothetical protein
MQVKYYNSKKVKPSYPRLIDSVCNMAPGQAFNIQKKDRQKYVTTISRLHKKGAGKWETIKISDTEIAVVRNQ